MTSIYKLNGIPIDRLFVSVAGTDANNYKTMTNYKTRDPNNDIEYLQKPLNYKIKGIDISNNATAHTISYTTVVSDQLVPTLITGTTSYYKHISAVIIGGGGGAGGAGGNGRKSDGGPKTNGGAGGSGAPSNVCVINNLAVTANGFYITVGGGGAGGGSGSDQGYSAGKGSDAAPFAKAGDVSSIKIGTKTYSNTIADGGEGGNAGTSNGSGNLGPSYTADLDDVQDSRKYDSYKIASLIDYGVGGVGSGNNDRAGESGKSGYVRVWFLYEYP